MCTEKFINPFTDFGFKRLFGSASDKVVMISFLNSLFGDEDPIVDITYQNTEQFGLSAADRRAVFDLYCTTQAGSHIIVEMQNGYQRYFIDRSVYYSSFPMQEAASKGEWDYRMPRIYMVAFLNFEMDRYLDTPGFRHTVRLCDVDTKEVVYDKLTFVYLEMPKFVKDRDELDGPFDTWMYIIKNLDQLNEMPHDLKDEAFRRFFERARIAAFTPEERQAYEISLKIMRDYTNIISSAVEKGHAEGHAEGRAEGLAEGRAEGLAEGRAEGLAEGRAEGRVEGRVEGRAEGRAEGEKNALIKVALTLKTQGMSDDEIATITNLTIEEIKELFA